MSLLAVFYFRKLCLVTLFFLIVVKTPGEGKDLSIRLKPPIKIHQFVGVAMDVPFGFTFQLLPLHIGLPDLIRCRQILRPRELHHLIIEVMEAGGTAILPLL